MASISNILNKINWSTQLSVAVPHHNNIGDKVKTVEMKAYFFGQPKAKAIVAKHKPKTNL